MTRFVSILLLVTACSPGVAERPVHCDDTGRCDLPDAELGKRALQLLGADVEGATARCRECHSLSRDGLRNWLELTKQARATCLAEGISSADAVACFRQDGAPADAMYPPKKLGIYAAGAHLDRFSAIFKEAYPGSAFLREFTRFKRAAGMPRGNYPKLTQVEFDIIADWFSRGLPNLEDLLPPGGDEPTTCTESISDELVAHAGKMALEGWGAVNRDRGMLMYGCGGATDALGCLADLPDAQTKSYGAGWAQNGGTLRVLYELPYTTFYWTRSSADGRFIGSGASGAGAGAALVDLQRGFVIPVSAAYDPGFFPDNSGFVFQGTSLGAGFCSYSLLLRTPDKITFSEAECGGVSGIELYQHMGASLGGGDYFVVNSEFESDDGGHSATSGDPSATFGKDAQVKLTPMIFDGSHYVGGKAVNVAAPYEGDTVISPSTTLLASRLAGPGGKQLGYVIRRVDAVKQADGYAITAPELGRVCTSGGKVSFSFDERFMTLHHYADGLADVYVYDFVAKRSVRVTQMQPGQYALYPHFRSDGWLHFLVRDTNSGKEYFVASDLALHLGK